MNAVGRPVGVVSRYRPPGRQGYSSTSLTKNLRLAQAQAEETLRRKGVRGVRVQSAPLGKGTMGQYTQKPDPYGGGPMKRLTFNDQAGDQLWRNVPGRTRELRRQGFLSTSDPRHVSFHESGHAVHASRAGYQGLSGKAPNLAGRVSSYARENAGEFVAEVFAGLQTGRKYDNRVMKEYRALMGLPVRPPARRRRKP
jgi:hypothetical protein